MTMMMNDQAATDPRQRAAATAIELAAERPFRDITLSDICAASGLALSDLYPMTGVDALLPEIDRLLDRAMSAEAVEHAASARDALFDVIMLRFDAMEERRGGLASTLAHVNASPLRRAAALFRRRETARWALVCARLEADGPAILDPAREAGLAFVIWQAETAWRNEDGSDLARTMAALDKGLRSWDRRMAQASRPFTGRRSSPQSAPPRPADAGQGSPSAD